MQDEALIKFQEYHIKSHHTVTDKVNAGEGKSVVNDLTTNDLSTVVEQSLEYILRTSFHNLQNGIPSVVYKIVEKVASGVLRTDVNVDRKYFCKERLLHINAASKGLSNMVIASRSFMPRIWTFVRGKTGTVLKKRK